MNGLPSVASLWVVSGIPVVSDAFGSKSVRVRLVCGGPGMVVVRVAEGILVAGFRFGKGCEAG